MELGGFEEKKWLKKSGIFWMWWRVVGGVLWFGEVSEGVKRQFRLGRELKGKEDYTRNFIGMGLDFGGFWNS